MSAPQFMLGYTVDDDGVHLWCDVDGCNLDAVLGFNVSPTGALAAAAEHLAGVHPGSPPGDVDLAAVRLIADVGGVAGKVAVEVWWALQPFVGHIVAERIRTAVAEDMLDDLVDEAERG